MVNKGYVGVIYRLCSDLRLKEAECEYLHAPEAS